MNDLERIVDDCVERMTNGTSTLEECLSAHAQHAAQLRPLLESVAGWSSPYCPQTRLSVIYGALHYAARW